MENITNFARGAETEFEREGDLAAEEYTEVPDVPEGTFGELPADPAITGEEEAPTSAELTREAEATLPPE